jgi:hypothetical protein
MFKPAIQRVPGFFLGEEWPGCEAVHSLPTKSEVKNEWSYTATPRVGSHGVEKSTFPLFATTMLFPQLYCTCLLVSTVVESRMDQVFMV